MAFIFFTFDRKRLFFFGFLYPFYSVTLTSSSFFSFLCTGTTMHSSGTSQESSQGTDRGGLVHSLSKETAGSPDPSELGSPRSTPNFDLLKMVESYKRIVLFLEPIADAVELTRFLLGCVCAPVVL